MISEELDVLIRSSEGFEQEISNLQIYGYCLNKTVTEMPWSGMKKYLINEMKEMMILDDISSLYRLKDKVLMVIMMIEDQGDVDNVLRLLEEMKISINNLINYTK